LLAMSRLQSLFRRKEIKVGKRPVERGYMLKAGDVLLVYGLRPEDVEAARTTSEATATGPRKERESATTHRPEPGEGYPMPPVLFEDEDLLVVDKPSGVAAHPGTGVPPGASLIERVHAHLGAPEAGWS